MEVRELPVPDLEPDSALLDVELSEVCGTDVYLQQGKLAGVPYPLIPGHVSVGRLNKIRGSLRDVEGKTLSEGDRITFLDVHRTCNACWYCLVAKATTRCPQRKVYGITYGMNDGLCGGWAEQIISPGTRHPTRCGTEHLCPVAAPTDSAACSGARRGNAGRHRSGARLRASRHQCNNSLANAWRVARTLYRRSAASSRSGNASRSRRGVEYRRGRRNQTNRMGARANERPRS